MLFSSCSTRSSALSCVGNSAVAHGWVVWRAVGAVVGFPASNATWPPLRAVLDRLRPPPGRRCHVRNGPARPQGDVSQAALDCRRVRRQVSIDHRWAQPGHCRCTSVPWLFSRYCQWVLQFRLPWQSWQPAPSSQLGHGSQARRERSAVGSIGNTSHRPIRQHAGADQLVVDPLLLLVSRSAYSMS